MLRDLYPAIRKGKQLRVCSLCRCREMSCTPYTLFVIKTNGFILLVWSNVSLSFSSLGRSIFGFIFINDRRLCASLARGRSSHVLKQRANQDLITLFYWATQKNYTSMSETSLSDGPSSVNSCSSSDWKSLKKACKIRLRVLENLVLPPYLHHCLPWRIHLHPLVLPLSPPQVRSIEKSNIKCMLVIKRKILPIT